MRYIDMYCAAQTARGAGCLVPGRYPCTQDGPSTLWFCLRHYRDHMYFAHRWGKDAIDQALARERETFS